MQITSEELLTFASIMITLSSVLGVMQTRRLSKAIRELRAERRASEAARLGTSG